MKDSQMRLAFLAGTLRSPRREAGAHGRRMERVVLQGRREPAASVAGNRRQQERRARPLARLLAVLLRRIRR